MKQGGVHAAARASSKALKRDAARKRKTTNSKPAKKTAAPQAKAKSKRPKKRSIAAVRAMHPAAAKPREGVFRRAQRYARAASTGLSAVLCLMATTVFLLASESSQAASEKGKTTALVAQMRDVDFDGKGDLANPTDNFIRARDAYGSGAFGAARDGGRRKHLGVDYIAAIGHDVHAPTSGRITRVGHAYNSRSGLNFIEIHDPDMNVFTRVFYIAPSVSIGQTVSAGDVIGTAQDLSKRYRGITNHVHVEMLDANGAHVDPTMLLPLPSYAETGGASSAAAR